MNHRLVYFFAIVLLVAHSCRMIPQREEANGIQTVVSENAELNEEIEILRVLNNRYKSTNSALEKEIKSLRFLNKYYKSVTTGISNNAIRANFGRFTLIKRNDVKVALKIIEHIMPRLDQPYHESNFMGAKYICYVWDDINRKYAKSSGKVFEPIEGAADNIYIDFGDFKIEWSRSDWLYFPDGVTFMARTEYVNVDDVDFDNPRLVWISKKNLRQETN